MTCKETEKMVMPYINGKLDEEELAAFMKHVETCRSCREELDIYYTVMLGLKQLDHGTGAYDIQRTLEESLEFSRLKIKTVKIRKVITYAVNTLCVVWLCVAVLLQLRLWLENGIF